MVVVFVMMMVVAIVVVVAAVAAVMIMAVGTRRHSDCAMLQAPQTARVETSYGWVGVVVFSAPPPANMWLALSAVALVSASRSDPSYA